MAGVGRAERTSSLLISAILILFVNIWNSPMQCSAQFFTQGLSLECDSNRPNILVDQEVAILDTPTPATTPCTFTFKKDANICQVRLDFLTYNSTGANGEGDCDRDQLRISNSITVDRNFTTCGNLDGQHMYLTFGPRDAIEVSPMLTIASSRYLIKATQIPCTSPDRAPGYCLQYFTTPTGKVKSFDFGGQQQNNQRYTVCVEPNEYYSTSVKWTPCTGVAGSAFDIVTPNNNDLLHPIICDTDSIQVKGLEKVCMPFTEQTSTWKPYDLLVDFDYNEYGTPPVVFQIPADPLNCAASCTDIGNTSCECVPVQGGPDEICQCITFPEVAPLIPGAAVSAGLEPDFNNTGFCLDYTQL